MKNIFLIINLLVLVLVLLTGCSSKQQSKNINTKNPDIIYLKKSAIKEAGFNIFTVIEKPVISEIVTTGQIQENASEKFIINSLATGRIIQDKVQLGDHVTAGQVVAVISNPEIVQINADFKRQLHDNKIAINQAQTKYTLAKINYEREKKLLEEGISARKDYIQAESEMIMSKEELSGFKQRASYIQSEAKSMLGIYGVSSNLNNDSLVSSIPITATASGVITKKNITVGSVVSPDQTLYEVSNLKELWLDITLYSQDVAKISEKQIVIFKPDSFTGKEFTGQIDYIQPISDVSTQTFMARAFINNSLGLLKPGMFGEIVIKSNIKQNKPFVPDQALQKYGKETFVFLTLGNGKYQKQLVDIGEKALGGHFINNGVQPGDKIVTNGSFTLKSELLKNEFAEEE